jgi:hypothetical protein
MQSCCIERQNGMPTKSAITLVWIMMASVGLPTIAAARAAPRYNIQQTCSGIIEQVGNPGWYSIGDCSFGPGAAEAKILSVCHEKEQCTLRAVGHTAPNFYVDRVISVSSVAAHADDTSINRFVGKWKSLGTDTRIFQIVKTHDGLNVTALDLLCTIK